MKKRSIKQGITGIIARAGVIDRIEHTDRGTRDRVTGQRTGTDWHCPNWHNRARCRAGIQSIDDAGVTCTNGHSSN